MVYLSWILEFQLKNSTALVFIYSKNYKKKYLKNFSPQLLGVNLRKTFLCLGLAFIFVIFLTSNFSDKEFERVFDLTFSKFCTFPSSLLITLSRFLSTSFGKLKPKSKIFKNSNICKYKKRRRELLYSIEF